MQQLVAITLLTVKAAFRFRLVTAVSIILVITVIVLPLVIKDDGTARGFIQIILTYTLSVITFLLGFVTLWLACGTLARDVEECQIQMVAVKPIPRWKIWMGKWCGIMLLNLMLLTGAGLAVYGLMQWRSQKLPPDQQQILENEVLVARGSLRPPIPDIEDDVKKEFEAAINKNPLSEIDREFLRNQIRQRLLAAHQMVPPGYYRPWVLDLGILSESLRDRPLYLRFRFHTPPDHYESTLAPPTYPGFWEIGSSEAPKWQMQGSWASNAYHELELVPNSFDEEGRLRISFSNMSEITLLFPVDEGIELLYKEGSFGMNFIRGLAVIYCWLGVLSALGLAAASFLGFSVASLLAICVLLVSFSGDTMSRVVQEGALLGVNHETGQANITILDYILLPIFRFALGLVNQVQSFSPIDFLSSGRSITWGILGQAILKIVFMMGGFLSLIGIAVFTRRELATAQGKF